MLEKVIKGIFKEFNVNVKRKTLDELLKEERPHVIINGKRHRIKRRELDLLKEIGDKDLKLPIVLEVHENFIVVKGKKEVKVIAKILDKEINPFEEPDILYIYKPELKIIRRELPTATQLIFKW
ncbi:DUF61 family protein [Methanocaldococcus indicus]|uniref:DUF61 family protein n=1 Tax=Methanocaldococcus indicus TaxID=213231 RepID=UPI003C6D4604